MDRSLDLKMRRLATMLIKGILALVFVSVSAVFAIRELFGVDVDYTLKSLAASAALWFWLSTAVVMGAKSLNKKD